VLAFITIRKVFACFAAASALLSCHVALCALAVIVIAVSGPIAAVTGIFVFKQLGQSAFSAALQCFAAGTLLGVSIVSELTT